MIRHSDMVNGHDPYSLVYVVYPVFDAITVLPQGPNVLLLILI